jgi:hypothetical protein
MIPSEYLIKDPTKLVKGQTIHHLLFGEGQIISVCSKIRCYFPKRDLNGTYLLDGKVTVNDEVPLIFLSNPFESQERVILVKFSTGWKEEKAVTFIEGKPIIKTYGINYVIIEDFNDWKELEPKEEEKEESIPVSQLRGKTIEEIYKLING